MQLRVQFPSGQPPYGSIKNITYAKEGVKIAGIIRLGELVGRDEVPDTYGKHAAPLARSSSVFGNFKKAESGSVQGATVNRRLVEPTNSASMDILYTSLGIVKKRLHLKRHGTRIVKGSGCF